MGSRADLFSRWVLVTIVKARQTYQIMVFGHGFLNEIKTRVQEQEHRTKISFEILGVGSVQALTLTEQFLEDVSVYSGRQEIRRSVPRLSALLMASKCFCLHYVVSVAHPVNKYFNLRSTYS